MIKVKSYFSDDVIDTIDYSGNLGCFFDGINPDWRLLKGVNASLFLNGDPVFLFELDSITLKDSDSFEIYIDPKGGIVSSVGKLLGGVLGFAFGFLLPSSRSANHNRVNTPQGQRLEASDIKVNQPRLGAVVPEGFGRYRRYMDNVTEIRRYFVDKRQQKVEALLCVGVGDYLVENMKVGDTDISAMDNTEYFQFAPNKNVGRFSEVWHTVKEVGATSSGTAGLELRVEPVDSSQMVNVDPSSGYSFTGDKGSIVTRIDGSLFNDNWSEGINVTIGEIKSFSFHEEFIIIGSSPYLAALIRGDFTGYNNTEDLVSLFPRRMVIHNGVFIMSEPRFHGSKQPNGQGEVIYTTVGEFPAVVAPWMFYDYHFPVGQTQDIITGNTYRIAEFGRTYIVVNTDNDLILLNGKKISIKYVDGSYNIPKWTNTFKATPKGVKTREIEVDFFFPQGLCWITDEGWVWQNFAPVEIQVIDDEIGRAHV